jgi:hypothetical protein
MGSPFINIGGPWQCTVSNTLTGGVFGDQVSNRDDISLTHCLE